MAKKPKLSDRQKRQVKENRDKRLNKKRQSHDDKHLGKELKGRVVGRFGKHANVELVADGSIHKCHIRRTINSVVCGDNVFFALAYQTMTAIAALLKSYSTESLR